MKRYHINTFIFLFASIATPAVCADEFTQLSLSIFGGGNSCNLKQVRSDSPRSYPGERTRDYCAVIIPKKEFNKEYEFCFSSGMGVTNPNKMDGFKCGVSYNETEAKFTALIELPSSVIDKHHNKIRCSFICKNKK